MKTKKQIIEETREYYEGHPERRAVYGAWCRYWIEDGKRCAVGRCMIPECAEKHAAEGPVGCLEQELDQLLREEYRGHETEFWEDLQDFHDAGAHWDHSGDLTGVGKNLYKDLLERWT